MKKLMMTAAVLAACGMVAGCFTSATAWTERTNPDGTIARSKMSVIGTGDKASEIAAEGLFADGTDADLGAGVTSANAKQQSSGIDGSITALVQLAGVIAPYLAAAQTGGVTAPAIAASSQQASATADRSYTFTAATTTQAGGSGSEASAVVASAVTTGAVEVVILGNRTTCSLCRSLWAGLDSASLSSALCGASIVDADAAVNASVYAARRPVTAFSYPLVRVYSGGTLVGQFSGAGLSQASLAAKVKALVPACGG